MNDCPGDVARGSFASIGQEDGVEGAALGLCRGDEAACFDQMVQAVHDEPTRVEHILQHVAAQRVHMGRRDLQQRLGLRSFGSFQRAAV